MLLSTKSEACQSTLHIWHQLVAVTLPKQHSQSADSLLRYKRTVRNQMQHIDYATISAVTIDQDVKVQRCTDNSQFEVR